MKLWSIIFTDPTAALVSARVAANFKQDVLDHFSLEGQSLDSVIVSYMGQVDVPQAGVIHMITRAAVPSVVSP